MKKRQYHQWFFRGLDRSVTLQIQTSPDRAVLISEPGPMRLSQLDRSLRLVNNLEEIQCGRVFVMVTVSCTPNGHSILQKKGEMAVRLIELLEKQYPSVGTARGKEVRDV